MGSESAASGIAGADAPKKWIVWTGRVLSGAVSLLLVASGVMKLTHQPAIIEEFVGRLGYAEAALTGVGLLEIACAVVYAVPRTAVLGAVLITGYFGGAVATHVRVGDAFVAPAILGLCAWAGIYLRDKKLRAFLPLRRVG